MPNDTFTFKTEVFEGPLDLLLELIEGHKLLINDIALAKVCDEYIARVEALGDMPLAEASQFVALAATLLLIKSRSLLPSLALTEDEDRDIKELEYRLALYQIIQGAARVIARQFGKAPLPYGEPPRPEPLFVPDPQVTPATLYATIERIIAEFPADSPDLPQAEVAKIASLEEMIEALGKRISVALKLSFYDYAGFGKKEKADIIVTFLALLELVKQGMVRVTQRAAFEDILLENEELSQPRYE